MQHIICRHHWLTAAEHEIARLSESIIWSSVLLLYVARKIATWTISYAKVIWSDLNPDMVKGTISFGEVWSKLSDCNKISNVSVEESQWREASFSPRPDRNRNRSMFWLKNQHRFQLSRPKRAETSLLLPWPHYRCRGVYERGVWVMLQYCAF